MEKPWYRHFWVWFMLTPLIATVLASFVTLILAGGPPALVVDDYGEIAMTIERDRRRDQRAAELNLVAEITFARLPGAAGQTVAVRLSGDSPRRLTLELVHPTLAALDRRVVLSRAGDLYSGTVARPSSRLYVLLTDDQGSWRLAGAVQTDRDSITLAAGR